MEDQEKEVGELQSLINAKASEQLYADIQKFVDFVNSTPILNACGMEAIYLAVVKKDEKGKLTKIVEEADTLDRLLTKWGILRKTLYNTHIDQYIQTATADFVNKVDSMRADLDNLMTLKDSGE